jgi:hypothetical protein
MPLHGLAATGLFRENELFLGKVHVVSWTTAKDIMRLMLGDISWDLVTRQQPKHDGDTKPAELVKYGAIA